MNPIPQLYKQWQSLQPLNPKLERDINQQFMIDFNYNSNHLEGNTLTYGQTKLLLLFGDTIGNASMQDYEEMKAHNVGLELMKTEAKDKSRTLSENFIRELNHTILVRDFYKTSPDGDYRYKIHVGVYKTRPNSVITPTGELFDYASPEETPSLMSDLVEWYRNEEQRGQLKVEELAALFHYRYIRIHPFEDGNGRIARLLVNYILLRNNYPMLVIRTDDRKNYLKALHLCDQLSGKIPYNGAHATLQQTKPLVDYISAILENKLTMLIQFVKGEIPEFIEAKEVEKNDTVKLENGTVKPENDTVNEIFEGVKIKIEGVKDKLNQELGIIYDFIKEKPLVKINSIEKHIQKSNKTVKRYLKILKDNGLIEYVGSDKTGGYKVL
ncbi:MAG: Fic family protein [Prevotellaceae bacterium]|jgi:Fic family protein|nr:Fic family protein [Prevotellaceae bacterium]